MTASVRTEVTGTVNYEAYGLFTWAVRGSTGAVSIIDGTLTQASATVG